MATVLLAWELGAGLGHLMNLRPLADGMARRGHRVVAALRDLSPTARRLIGPDVGLFQAPFKHQRMRDVEPSCTFAHVLHNIGFADAEELAALGEAWQNLYRAIEPDLIVFEHSPTALFAARGFPARRVVLGNGFYCPPDVTPLPNLRTWLRPNPAQLQADESRILRNINDVLRGWSEAPLERVTQLFHPAEQTILLTFRELDPQPQRGPAEYWGAWSAGLGEPVAWPPGEGRKIFGYLKRFPALPQLLEALKVLPNPIVMYVAGMGSDLRRQFGRDNLRFADGPVEMGQAARECDLAILDGTHASTAALLLAGKPALNIPIFLEHALTANAAAKLGAAICVSPKDPAKIVAGLTTLLTSDQFAAAAQAFAARYADFDPQRQIERIVDRVEELAASATVPSIFAPPAAPPPTTTRASATHPDRFDAPPSTSQVRRPHVILYTDDPGVGGVAQYNLALLEALAGMHYRVTTIASRRENPLYERQKVLGIEQRWLSFDSYAQFKQTLQNHAEARKLLLLDGAPDLIFFSNGMPYSNFAAKRVALSLGIPYVVVEGFVAHYLAERFKKLSAELNSHYRGAAAVIAVSRENLELLRSEFSLPATMGQVIHYGRPDIFFTPRDMDARRRVRSELSIPDDAVLCLTTARLEPIKGFQLQARAIQKLRSQPVFSQLYFAWAGDGATAGDLRRGLAQMGIANRVRLLGQRWDVPDLLDAADIFVLPSHLEGMPLAIMEAMAKSLPVVATAVSGIPEELGSTGRLIADPKIEPEKTADQLAETLAEWGAEPDLRAQIGSECHARARELFTQDRMIDETIRVIDRALLPARDYVAPSLEFVRPDAAFPNLTIVDPTSHPWSYVRREIPHNFYCDRRKPLIGFVSRDEASILYNTALRFAGKPALEVGCWMGWSTCHMALGGARLDVVDPMLADARILDEVTRSLRAAGGLDQVTFWAGSSPEKVEEIGASENRRWSLIFIDGNHDDPAPLRDAVACERFADADAIVLFHDLNSPAVARGLDYFRSKGWNTMVYQTMQIMGVAWRGQAQPVQHVPDPRIRWRLPPHLADYRVSGVAADSDAAAPIASG